MEARIPGESAAADMLSALGDASRLRIIATIAEAGERGVGFDAVAGAAASPSHARKSVGRLVAAGLVEARGPTYVARLDRMREAVAPSGGEGLGDADRWRGFFSRGRLTTFPRAPAVRQELLARIAERFERDRSYGEPEVNATLREIHDDHATLRRYLVDAGLLARDAAGTRYRRP